MLLVENDGAVRELASRILRDAGLRVLEAAGGPAAIEICAGAGGRIDLIVADLVMPEMWGDELARRLREAFPKLRILYISGHSESVHRGRWKSAGGSFLEKPFTAEELLGKVRSVLDA